MRVKKSMFLYYCLTATSPHVSDPAQLCRWPRGLWNPPGGSFSTQVSVSLPTILPWGQTKTIQWVYKQVHEEEKRTELLGIPCPPLAIDQRNSPEYECNLCSKFVLNLSLTRLEYFHFKPIMKPLITTELHTSAPHVIAAKQYILHTRSKQQ